MITVFFTYCTCHQLMWVFTYSYFSDPVSNVFIFESEIELEFDCWSTRPLTDMQLVLYLIKFV